MTRFLSRAFGLCSCLCFAFGVAGGLPGVALAAPAPSRVVQVTSTPPGATVYLGSKEGTKLGVTPIKRARLPLGAQELLFVLEGHRAEKLAVTVERRTRTLSATLAPVSVLTLSPSSEEARGASVTVDGLPRGEVPVTVELEPGRRFLEVRKPGFHAVSQWLELAPKQTMGLQIALVAQARPMGTVFVSSDVLGAQVKIDGVERGAAPLSVDLPEGPTLVEVSAGELPPFKTTIEVRPGQKQIVEARLRPDTGPRGSVLLLSNVPGASMKLDGEDVGAAPVTKDQLVPGLHLVEAVADGFEPHQGTVQVKVGEQTVYKAELKEIQAEFGRLSVRASVPGAQVFVDGGARGPAPVELEQISLGLHKVVVRAEGHQDFVTECEVKRNQLCSIVAAMTPTARVRVTANVTGNTRLFIDGQEMGPVPFEGTVPVGAHTFKVEADGASSAEQLVTLQAGSEPRELAFSLRSTEPTSEEIAIAETARLARHRGATPLTGLHVGPNQYTFALGVGMPSLVELTGSVGVLERLAMVAGIRLVQRSTELGLGELSLRAHSGVRPVEGASFGAQVEGWGGTNFSGVSSWGGSASVLSTLHFGAQGSFSLAVTGEAFSDRWRGWPSLPADTDGQAAARLKLSGTVAYWLSLSVAVTATLEGRLLGGERQLHRALLFGALQDDPSLYGRVSLLWSFGS